MFRIGVSDQNRGYDGCGFSLYDYETNTTRTYRGENRVVDVFSANVDASEVPSTRGILGIRYRTAGDVNSHNIQPIIAGGYAVAHNGNILNIKDIAKRHNIQAAYSDSDTRVIAELIKQSGSIERGIEIISEEALGAYNLAIMDPNGKIGFYRDPWGFHPLFGGIKGGSVYAASEEAGIHSLEIYNPVEFKPGELWIVNGDHLEKKYVKPNTVTTGKGLTPVKMSICPFELSYFMRPGGSFNGTLVSKFREDAGERMAERDRFPNNGEYIVVPVHDSGRHYAVGYNRASGMRMEIAGLLGNRDMSRLYMQEEKMAKLGLDAQEMAALKNMPTPAIIRGKKVVVTDDTIVRAGTTPRIVRNLHAAGAKEIHLRICAPPIISSCHMGSNHSDASKLRARRAVENPIGVSLEEIEEKVRLSIDQNLTSLHYLPMEDYIELLNDDGDHCFGCFTGHYPFPIEELYN